MKWKAWYTDNRTYEGSTAEEWKAMPPEGVLYVAVYRDTGVTYYNGGDWYFWEDGGIQKTMAAPWGSHTPRPDGCLDCMKKGVGVPDEEFWALHRRIWDGD